MSSVKRRKTDKNPSLEDVKSKKTKELPHTFPEPIEDTEDNRVIEENEEVEEDEAPKSFKDLGIVDSLCEACDTLGYKAPTPIQRESIPLALQGRDLIGLAETGSGKTAAFALPILQALLDKPQPLFGLVLAPTRELAYQISQQFEALGSVIRVKCAVIVGGMDMVPQSIALGKKPHIIVATPGRLLDHLENTKGFSLRSLKYLVMDEADRLLDLDFGPILDKILKVLPRERRTYLFSATISSKVESLQRASLKDPLRVSISSNKYQTVSTLIQNYIFIPLVHKDTYLIYLLNEFAGQSAIIFTRTVNETQRIAILLRTLGFGAIPLHGQLSQSSRLGALNKFRAGSREILVATDVAARGLDIPSVDVVLNYDMPQDSKTYIHRVGRTARAGKSGHAISFVTQYDVEIWMRIEAALGKKQDEYPTVKDEVMVFKPRVEEAQRHARNEMKNLHEDRGKKGAVLKGRRPANGAKRGRDEMDREEASRVLWRSNGFNPMIGHTRRRGLADASTNDMTLPLKGYKVLDMTRVLAGPYCTQILGDLGAEVIKVEHPTKGDDTRHWGPPYAKYLDGSGKEGPGESAYFFAVNRNKKSLGLSFKHPSAVKILHKLAAESDILVENYLPGSLKKYGMDYETLREINPRLIYASITGYGQTGPYRNRAGYDVMVEAEMGLMHITGSRDGPPVKVGVAVTDLTTGLYTSNSIMAALLARGRTGRGQHIDVALSDCQVATLSNLASSCLISGKKDEGRWGTAHPSIVPYRSYKTKDGDILFGGGNDRLFGLLCNGLGRPEWKEDPRFVVNTARVAHRADLDSSIEKITQDKTTKEWLDIFEGSGLPYAAINDVQGTLNHEHVLARDMVKEMDHEYCGPIKMVNTPVKYSESKPSIRTVPPMLGQHTDEILRDILGMDESDIEALKAEGAMSLGLVALQHARH
ncbi:putative atp-dependent rrna helicase rrp3 protein [Botrytis fragariae]|uniref:Putative atp-dependent rrna helicase rrp3 protein n=1 Tax=Botrytis fragariae TaxID=1964551 RepID=A0A8H6AGU4_9HELO|nr:putative atp-dependent rrna helicase rrp3 protein [Botrytis fragariae]KAF5867402.1 putative atp-dependent rrna helicase rrp3 protein [Botrytis fragariae]